MKQKLKKTSNRILILLLILSWGITIGTCAAGVSRGVKYESDRKKWAKEKDKLIQKLSESEYYKDLYVKIKKQK